MNRQLRRAGSVVGIGTIALCLSAVAFVATRSTLAAPIVAMPELVNMGRVAQGGVFSCEVRVKNITRNLVHIQSVQASCGCTTASHMDSIGAGQSATLRIRFDARNLIGPVTKTISITTANEPARPVVITLAGTVAQGLVATPPTLNLGDISETVAATQDATITRADGRPLVLSAVDEPRHARAWLIRLGPASYKLHVVAVGSGEAGDYEDAIVIRGQQPDKAELDVPVRYHLTAPYAVTPRNLDLGVMTDGHSGTASVEIEGAGPSRVTLGRCPPGATAHLQRHGERGCRVSVIYRPKGGKHYLVKDVLTVITHEPRHPKIVIPVYGVVP
jgi:hypothetical protein